MVSRRFVVALALTASCASFVVGAQELPRRLGGENGPARADKALAKRPVPKLPDGTVDLYGLWRDGGDARFPNQMKPGELDSILLPWAKQLMATRKETDNPYFYCMPGGPIRLTGGFGWRFLQHPTVNAKYIFQIQEGNSHSYRQIFMDGRKHPEDPSPTWYGHSIGRWEGPTLVIDTMGMNDKFWMDRNGTPHTEQLHLVERWTRDTFITMQRAVTVDDPGAFSRPFTVNYTASLADEGQEILEYFCVENNQYRPAERSHEPGAVRAITLRVLVLASLLAFFGAAAPAAAHPAPFSYLDVRLQGTVLEVSAVVHAFDVAYELKIEPIERVLDVGTLGARSPAIAALLNERLRVMVDGAALGPSDWSLPEPIPDRQSLRLRTRYMLDGTPGVITVSAYLFPYDPVHQTFVNVYEGDELVTQAILDQGRREFEHTTGTRQGTLAVIRKFVASGIHHILIGPDHMLFLVGLLLLGGTVRRLVVVVSAFTLAHSITLSLAALNIFDPPASIVEPAIALSIVFIGVDNLIVRGGRDVRAWIAFAFGFVHGFGFAGVLREMGLESRALVWSLLSFNVGVEIGQLFVVIVVATALAALRTRSEAAGRWLAVAGSIGVIAAGTFWFFERVFFGGRVA